jgi:hypothetical protein
MAEELRGTLPHSTDRKCRTPELLALVLKQQRCRFRRRYDGASRKAFLDVVRILDRLIRGWIEDPPGVPNPPEIRPAIPLTIVGNPVIGTFLDQC